MSSVEGPDFICAGTPKAGSGWLYDQLEMHPDFWMPPVKEIVYLGNRNPRLKFAQPERNPHREKSQQPRERHLRRMRDARDLQFVEYARGCMDKPMELDRYVGLFAFKGELLSGDISPTYSSLKAHIVADLAQRLSNTKIIFLVREPVSRFWSRISMLHRSNNFDESLAHDAARFRGYLEDSERQSFAQRGLRKCGGRMLRRCNSGHFYLTILPTIRRKRAGKSGPISALTPTNRALCRQTTIGRKPSRKSR